MFSPSVHRNFDLLRFELMLNLGLLQANRRIILLDHAELERILTPAREGLLQVTMLRHVEVVSQDAACVVIKVVLSGHHPDPLENFDSQRAASNSTNHIDSVLLSPDVVDPILEDVASLLDVDIVVNAAAVRLKSSLKHVLHVVSITLGFLKLGLELLLLFLLFNALLSTLPLQGLPSGLLFIQVDL